MPSILKRSLVLSFSRLANQVILSLSPLFLVRILSVGEYGSYREFILYAATISSTITLGAGGSLAYFIPKHPDRERVWVTQVNLFFLVTSLMAVTGVWIAGDLIRSNTSFDFVTTLQLYIFFFVNLDFLERYWLAKKRINYVFYFSSGRMLARVTVLLWAAVETENAHAIVQALVWLEIVRFCLVFMFVARKRIFSARINKADLIYQFSYFAPMAVGGVFLALNQRIGQLFISTTVGVEALAFYFMGWFAVPIVNILRGSIADVIFPEIMALKTVSAKKALPLWRQATIWYCILLFPVMVLFAYYADAIVIILFTDEYAATIPIFAVFSAILFISCFDFHLPLRVRNANRYYVTATIIALIINVILMYPLYQLLGLIGPALALVASQLMMTAYLGYQASRLYDVRFPEMLEWRKIGQILSACLLCAPILIIGKVIIESLLVRCIVFGGLYLFMYLVILRAMKVWDAFRELRDRLEARGVRLRR